MSSYSPNAQTLLTKLTLLVEQCRAVDTNGFNFMSAEASAAK